jgi:hypothetical protein
MHQKLVLITPYRMCDDYNLCDNCEETSLDIHDKYHAFIVLPYACTSEPSAGRLIPYEFFNKKLTDEALKVIKRMKLTMSRKQLEQMPQQQQEQQQQ